MDAAAREQLRARLVGAVCRAIEHRGNHLQCRLDARLLVVNAMWRLSHEGTIVATSDAEDADLDAIPALVSGQTVRDATCRGEFNDLRLEFDGGTVLEVFTDSEKYEGWNLLGGFNDAIIAGPGRNWAVWPVAGDES